MIIQVRNILDQQSPITYTTYPEVAGTNVLRWKNADQMGASYAIQVGATGIPQSEIVLLSSSTPAGTAGTLTGNTLFEHPTDTPLYGIKYDQVVFEVSLTGTAGVAAPITNGTVTIQPNSNFTYFDHTGGTNTYAYKTYYKNSITGSTTIESDWITTAGFDFYSLANIRNRVRGRLYNSDYLQDSDIDYFTNEWLQMMFNAQVDVNDDYGLGTMGIAYGAGVELGTVTANDFRGGFKRVWYTESSGTFEAFKMDSNGFSPNQIFTTTYPRFYMQGDSIIGRKPIDNAGTFIVEYYKQTPILVNDTDVLPVPMQAFTKSFIDYGVGMALHKDNKHAEAAPFEASASGQLQMYKTAITPRNVSSATMINIVEGVGDDNGWMI